MSRSDDEILNALYATRQELFKQLNDIDQTIKNQELAIEQKKNSSHHFLVEEYLPGNDESGNKLSQFIARAMGDSTGSREALKTVDACKYIQENESLYGPEKMRIRNGLVREVIARFSCLSQNPFGSDLLVKVIGILHSGTVPAVLHLEPDQEASSPRDSELLLLIHQIGDAMPKVCCDTHGARIIQRLVDSLTTVEELSAFVNSIADRVVDLAKDINGNHSIAKVMAKLGAKTEKEGDTPPHQLQSDELQSIIYTRLSQSCTEICTNRQGCCIIQKCILLAPPPFKEKFICAILSNALKLVQDPFGNYVVQHILDKEENKEHEPGEYTNQIIRQMLHHISELSCNKFSSNVVEKCLKTAASDVRQLMIDELTDPQVLPKLLTDSFANYVIQTALFTASDAQHNQLRDAITPHQALLKNSPYGVKIEAKLAKRQREMNRKQTANKKKDSYSRSSNTNVSMQIPTVFPVEGHFSNNNYRPTQNYAPMNISSPEGFIPGMGFSTLVSGDSNPAIMRNIFAANMPPDLSLYSSPMPYILNQPPAVPFNQCPDSLASSGQQQPPYPRINVVQRNPMMLQYTSR